MFPLRDDNPTVHTSLATFTIIALNIASWIFIQGFGFNPALAKSICKFGLITGELFGNVSSGTQIRMGKGVVCVIDGYSEWITVITSMFMHGSWFHLLGNMWFLSIFGDNVEDAMGSVKFFIFYILCGMAAIAAQMISNPFSSAPMVGASGAIGGVMGAYAVLYPLAPVHMLVFFGFFFTRIVVPAFFMLGYWFFLQFVGGFFSIGVSSGGVAFWAHIGGFIAGIVFLSAFCDPKRAKECRKKRGSTHRIIRRIK